jgi:hypothetical protein
MLGLLDRQRLFAFLFQNCRKPAEICGFLGIAEVTVLADSAGRSATTPSNQGGESLESDNAHGRFRDLAT